MCSLHAVPVFMWVSVQNLKACKSGAVETVKRKCCLLVMDRGSSCSLLNACWNIRELPLTLFYECPRRIREALKTADDFLVGSFLYPQIQILCYKTQSNDQHKAITVFNITQLNVGNSDEPEHVSAFKLPFPYVSVLKCAGICSIWNSNDKAKVTRTFTWSGSVSTCLFY